MVELKINIKKSHIFAVIAMIVLVGFVMAYGGTQPNVMGHSDGEIEVTGVAGNPSLRTWSAGIQGIMDSISTRVTNLEVASACPNGMLSVGDFCVDSLKRANTGITWFDAVDSCADAGLHLCSGRELVAGCMLAGVGPNWISVNGEWAGDVVGPGIANLDDAAVYGFGGGSSTCYNTNVAHRVTLTTPGYRCCKSR